MIEFIDTSYSLPHKAASDCSVHNVGYEACPPGYAYGPRICPYHLLHFVYKGCGELHIDGKAFPVKEGEAFYIPAEKIASYQASETNPWSYAWIGYLGHNANRLTQKYFHALGDSYVIPGLDVQKYFSLIKEAAHFQGASDVNFFLANACLLRILGELISDTAVQSKVIQRSSFEKQARYMIEMRYSDKLRMKDLASSLGVHPNFLTSAFKQTYGITPKQFLTQCRLEKACSLLKTTNLPLSLIAESIGFEDQMSFSKAFRQAYQQTPSSYRAQKQAQEEAAPPETLEDYVRYVNDEEQEE